VSGLGGAARLWLWDFERGSLPYDILVVLMIIFVFVVPDSFVVDPLRTTR
jgi:hypothetical protein